jgi:hypothetical protein
MTNGSTNSPLVASAVLGLASFGCMSLGTAFLPTAIGLASISLLLYGWGLVVDHRRKLRSADADRVAHRA